MREFHPIVPLSDLPENVMAAMCPRVWDLEIRDLSESDRDSGGPIVLGMLHNVLLAVTQQILSFFCRGQRMEILGDMKQLQTTETERKRDTLRERFRQRERETESGQRERYREREIKTERERVDRERGKERERVEEV
jgi:hypothetical protein